MHFAYLTPILGVFTLLPFLIGVSSTSSGSRFNLNGIKCQRCATNVKNLLSALDQNVEVYFDTEKYCSKCPESPYLIIHPNISLVDINNLLIPKNYEAYSKSNVREDNPTLCNDNAARSSLFHGISQLKLAFKTYLPLVSIISSIICVALAIQLRSAGGIFISRLVWKEFCSNFMGLFFITFSILKLANLSGFARMFAQYDPIAAKFNSYGYIYPFIELGIGILTFARWYTRYVDALTATIMFISSAGIWKSLQEDKQIQCACLGANFNLPISKVSLVENLIMGLFALYSFVSTKHN
jgi:hypothetical protein